MLSGYHWDIVLFKKWVGETLSKTTLQDAVPVSNTHQRNEIRIDNVSDFASRTGISEKPSTAELWYSYLPQKAHLVGSRALLTQPLILLYSSVHKLHHFSLGGLKWPLPRQKKPRISLYSVVWGYGK